MPAFVTNRVNVPNKHFLGLVWTEIVTPIGAALVKVKVKANSSPTLVLLNQIGKLCLEIILALLNQIWKFEVWNSCQAHFINDKFL